MFEKHWINLAKNDLFSSQLELVDKIFNFLEEIFRLLIEFQLSFFLFRVQQEFGLVNDFLVRLNTVDLSSLVNSGKLRMFNTLLLLFQ